MSVSIEKVRYFEISHPDAGIGNSFLVETVTWQQTSDDDPRGVTLAGETGKFIWIVANNPMQLLPVNTDPAYWDYYALPPNPAFSIVQELTQAAWVAAMSTRAAELATLKGRTPSA